MITLLLHLLRTVPVISRAAATCSSPDSSEPRLAAATTVYKRMAARPRLRTTDRRSGSLAQGLDQVEASPRDRDPGTPSSVATAPLPRGYWDEALGRGPHRRSRPAVHAANVKTLIILHGHRLTYSGRPPRESWRTPEVGLDVAERTVSRLMPSGAPGPLKPGRTFLANHVRESSSPSTRASATSRTSALTSRSTRMRLTGRAIERSELGKVIPIREVGDLSSLLRPTCGLVIGVWFGSSNRARPFGAACTPPNRALTLSLVASPQPAALLLPPVVDQSLCVPWPAVVRAWGRQPSGEA